MGLLDNVRKSIALNYIIGTKGNLPRSLQSELMRTIGKASYTPMNYENMVTLGWRKNELIFSCINKTAMTASQVGMKVYTKKGDPIPAHPLQKLIERPNPFMSEFQFWYAVQTFLKLAGVAYFERVKSGSGATAQLWAMRPDWTFPVFSPTKYIEGYEYKVPGRQPIFLKTEDVLRFSLFDPINLFMNGWAPINVASRIGDVDNSATDFLKLFWEKGGMPAGVLTTKSSLKPEDVTELRKRWRERYGGYENWLEPAILDKDATFQRIGLTAEELGFDFIDERDEARICSVLDVPPIIVGARLGLDRATYSNYEQARKAWWEDSLMPQYELFDDVINNDLAGEYGDSINVKWDYSRVPALQDDVDKLWRRLGEALRDGAITINEYRSGVGKDEIDGGNVRMISMGMQMVGEDQEMYQYSTPEPEPDPDPEEDDDQEEESEDPEDPEKTLDPETYLKLSQALKSGEAPDDLQRRKDEKILEGELDKFFQAEMKRIQKELR